VIAGRCRILFEC